MMSGLTLSSKSPSPSTSPTIAGTITSSESESAYPDDSLIHIKPIKYQVEVNHSTNTMNPFASVHASTATFICSNPFNDFDDATPIQEPAEAHTRESLHYDDTAEPDLFSEDAVLVFPAKPWARNLDTHGETNNIQSTDTFHNARPNSPSPYPPRVLRRTDSLPVLTPTLTLSRRSRREVARTVREEKKSLAREAQLTRSVDEQDHKLRLARAKEQVRVLKELSPTASPSRFSLSSFRSKQHRKAREVDRQITSSGILGILRSPGFWSAVLLFLMGVASTSAAAGVMITMKTDSENTGEGFQFWMVFSVVMILVGFGGISICVMRNGKLCLGFLKRLGFGEVQKVGDQDLEKARPSGLWYLGVCDRDPQGSTLGGSTISLPRTLRSNTRREGEWVTGTLEAVKAVTIDTVDYNGIDPEWRDLYTTPDASRYLASIRSTTPYEPSKLRNSVSQEDKGADLGVQCQQFGGRMWFAEDHGFEMADLTGK